MDLTIILDASKNADLLPDCALALSAAASEVRFKLLVSATDFQALPNLAGDPEVVYSAGPEGARLNAAAKLAPGKFILFLRPWVLTDANAISALLGALERDLSIACAAPKLVTPDGKPAVSEFILIQDECKRKPIDVLVRPPDPGRTESWPLPPADGVAYKSDALMVRTAAFWGAGGWDEEFEGNTMDLTLGLAFKEQHWRCAFVLEAVMITLRPAADAFLTAGESRALVMRWFGRFMPHALRTSDGIIRSHPWCATGMSSAPAGLQHASGPFDPIAVATDYRQGDIPGERCSVIVVTYNSMDSIRACVAGIFETLGTFDEVIFVDNASRDQTPEFLTSLTSSDPRVKVILNEKNLGFSAGCNIGIHASVGEYVVLLNPDTVVIEGWLGRMRNYFQDTAVGAIGPISDGVCGLQRYEFHFPRKTPDGLSPSEVHNLAGQVNARRGVDSKLLIGFCLMLKRSVLDQVGLLDEELFLGCDDLDISWRLRLAGYKLLIATDVFVLHRVHVSFKTESSEVVDSLTQKSCDAFARKLIGHYGEGCVPSQEELWGIDWFESRVSVWNEVACA